MKGERYGFADYFAVSGAFDAGCLPRIFSYFVCSTLCAAIRYFNGTKLCTPVFLKRFYGENGWVY